MFEIPEIYKEGMEINHKVETVISKDVEIGHGRTKKVKYVVSWQYLCRLLKIENKKLKEEKKKEESEELKQLKKARGENEAYIQELEEETAKLSGTVKSLKALYEKIKEENRKYKSKIKEGEMYKEQQEKIAARDKNCAALRSRQTQLVSDLLKKDREISDLKDTVMKLEAVIKDLEEGVI